MTLKRMWLIKMSFGSIAFGFDFVETKGMKLVLKIKGSGIGFVEWEKYFGRGMNVGLLYLILLC